MNIRDQLRESILSNMTQSKNILTENTNILDNGTSPTLQSCFNDVINAKNVLEDNIGKLYKKRIDLYENLLSSLISKYYINLAKENFSSLSNLISVQPSIDINNAKSPIREMINNVQANLNVLNLMNSSYDNIQENLKTEALNAGDMFESIKVALGYSNRNFEFGIKETKESPNVSNVNSINELKDLDVIKFSNNKNYKFFNSLTPRNYSYSYYQSNNLFDGTIVFPGDYKAEDALFSSSTVNSFDIILKKETLFENGTKEFPYVIYNESDFFNKLVKFNDFNVYFLLKNSLKVAGGSSIEFKGILYGNDNTITTNYLLFNRISGEIDDLRIIFNPFNNTSYSQQFQSGLFISNTATISRVGLYYRTFNCSNKPTVSDIATSVNNEIDNFEKITFDKYYKDIKTAKISNFVISSSLPGEGINYKYTTNNYINNDFYMKIIVNDDTLNLSNQDYNVIRVYAKKEDKSDWEWPEAYISNLNNQYTLTDNRNESTADKKYPSEFYNGAAKSLPEYIMNSCILSFTNLERDINNKYLFKGTLNNSNGIIKKFYNDETTTAENVTLELSVEFSKDYKNLNIKNLLLKILKTDKPFFEGYEDINNLDITIYDSNKDYEGSLILSLIEGTVEFLNSNNSVNTVLYGLGYVANLANATKNSLTVSDKEKANKFIKSTSDENPESYFKSFDIDNTKFILKQLNDKIEEVFEIVSLEAENKSIEFKNIINTILFIKNRREELDPNFNNDYLSQLDVSLGEILTYVESFSQEMSSTELTDILSKILTSLENANNTVFKGINNMITALLNSEVYIDMYSPIIEIKDDYGSKIEKMMSIFDDVYTELIDKNEMVRIPPYIRVFNDWNKSSYINNFILSGIFNKVQIYLGQELGNNLNKYTDFSDSEDAKKFRYLVNSALKDSINKNLLVLDKNRAPEEELLLNINKNEQLLKESYNCSIEEKAQYEAIPYSIKSSIPKLSLIENYNIKNILIDDKSKEENNNTFYKSIKLIILEKFFEDKENVIDNIRNIYLTVSTSEHTFKSLIIQKCLIETINNLINFLENSNEEGIIKKSKISDLKAIVPEGKLIEIENILAIYRMLWNFYYNLDNSLLLYINKDTRNYLTNKDYAYSSAEPSLPTPEKEDLTLWESVLDSLKDLWNKIVDFWNVSKESVSTLIDKIIDNIKN